MFQLKQFLIRIGRRLILLEYVAPTPVNHTNLRDANAEIGELNIQVHDMRHTIRDLHQQVRTLKISLSKKR